VVYWRILQVNITKNIFVICDAGFIVYLVLWIVLSHQLYHKKAIQLLYKYVYQMIFEIIEDK
jgi:hypothetical protein